MKNKNSFMERTWLVEYIFTLVYDEYGNDTIDDGGEVFLTCKKEDIKKELRNYLKHNYVDFSEEVRRIKNIKIESILDIKDF